MFSLQITIMNNSYEEHNHCAFKEKKQCRKKNQYISGLISQGFSYFQDFLTNLVWPGNFLERREVATKERKE